MKKALVMAIVILAAVGIMFSACSKKRTVPVAPEDLGTATPDLFSTQTAVAQVNATNTAIANATGTAVVVQTQTAVAQANATNTAIANATGTAVMAITQTYIATTGASTFTHTNTATYTNTATHTHTYTNTNTNTATNTHTATIDATATNTPPAKPAGWIDDCEDTYGPNQNDFQVTGGPVLNTGGYWITYDDNATNNNGTSYVWPMSQTWAVRKAITQETFAMSAPGYAGSLYGTAYAARITGYVTTNTAATQPPDEATTGFQYGFIGFGMQLSPTAGQDWGCHEVDITAFTGIRFWCKGDGQSWRLKIPFTDQVNCDGNVTYTASSYTHDDDWGKNFVAPTDWTQIEITFATLAQEGWGKTSGGCSATTATNFALSDGVVLSGPACPILPTATSLILQHAKQIQIQSVGQGAAVVYPNSREIWIDDVELF